MRSLLVDPFQRKVHVVEVGPHIGEWYKWCDCDCFDHLALGEYEGVMQDLWVDDEGLLHEPRYPMFMWGEYPNPLAGYGLINASIGPETVATKMPSEFAQSQIKWEPWEGRLNPEDYFDQISRLYMIGSGKTLKGARNHYE